MDEVSGTMYGYEYKNSKADNPSRFVLLRRNVGDKGMRPVKYEMLRWRPRRGLFELDDLFKLKWPRGPYTQEILEIRNPLLILQALARQVYVKNIRDSLFKKVRKNLVPFMGVDPSFPTYSDFFFLKEPFFRLTSEVDWVIRGKEK